MMHYTSRTHTVCIASLCTFLAIGCSLAAHEAGGLIVAGIVGVLAVLGVAGIVWWLLAPLARLASEFATVADGSRSPADLTEGPGDLASVVVAAKELERQRSEFEQLRADLTSAYLSDLGSIADALGSLADSKATPAVPTLVAPFPESVNAFQGKFSDATRSLTQTRQRLDWATRILSGLPDAVVVTDGNGIPRYLNAAAEKMFGVSATVAARSPVTALLRDVETDAGTGDDPPYSAISTAAVGDWLKKGATGSVTAGVRPDGFAEVRATVPSKGAGGAGYFVFRDVTAARSAEPVIRATVRANATRRALDRYLAEVTEPIAVLGAQLRLLAGDAKHSAQKSEMLPRLTAAREALQRLETHHDIARWFRSGAWNELPPVSYAEVSPAEITQTVAARLAVRLKARGNEVKIPENSGWVVTDPERLEVALLGLLTHAADAAFNTRIELRVNRTPPTVDRQTGTTELHLTDLGQAPQAGQLDVVSRPFGATGPAQLDRFDTIGGNPLGLVVAARMAPTLGGILSLESGADGRLSARLLIPTRPAGESSSPSVASATPGAFDVAPPDEVVSGWRLGVPNPQLPA